MFMKKIFAAGMAVVGMVGMASAQSPIATNALGAGAPTGKMEVSYLIESVAAMTVTPRGTLKDKALFAGAINVAASAPGGNLGRIDLETNYAHWDIEVFADNKLNLSSGGTPYIPPADGWGTGTPAQGGVPIKVSVGGAAAAVKPLTVYIGILNSLGTGFETNTYTDFSTALTTATGAAPASFAKVIGATIGTNQYNLQTGEATAGTPAAGDISYDGFNTPTGDGKVTFFVNAPLGGAADKVAGSEDGLYTETLNFTFVAGF